MGTVAVAVCVLCGHQRDVPAHSMLQLCAEVSCRSCMRQQSAGHTLTDQPAAPVVAPCVCLRACVSRCRGAVGASHPLSQGRNQLQRRSSPPPPLAKVVCSEDGADHCVCVCAVVERICYWAQLGHSQRRQAQKEWKSWGCKLSPAGPAPPTRPPPRPSKADGRHNRLTSAKVEADLG